ncbi:MAG: glycosyltransferase family 2 protein [Mariprofundaceae bacterium]
MATFHGTPFVAEQIMSICSQSEKNWKLYIRDDASQDATLTVLDAFAEKDCRIRLLKGDCQLGAKSNFSFLLEQLFLQKQAHYTALADQDDVWVSEKIESQIKVMHQMEEQYGKETPLLIFCDLEVVDQRLNLLHESFMRHQGMRNEVDSPLSVLLAQNYVTGCGVLINHRLLEIALPIPKEALMHDWWLALCAAACGEIEYIDKPLVKYRQHASNEVGAKSFKSYLNPFKTSWLVPWLKGRDNLLASLLQARLLANRIKDRDPENPHLPLIEEYAALIDLSPLQRIRKLYALGVHMQKPLRHILMLSRLLFLPKIGIR